MDVQPDQSNRDRSTAMMVSNDDRQDGPWRPNRLAAPADDRLGNVTGRIASQSRSETTRRFRWVPWVLGILVVLCLCLAVWVWLQILRIAG
jgi:hypothetical protein